MAIGLVMLMKPDKKKMASLIVAANKPAPEVSEISDVESDNSMAEEAAAEDLLAAIEQKSPKGIVDAIKAIMDIIEPNSEPVEEEQ